MKRVAARTRATTQVEVRRSGCSPRGYGWQALTSVLTAPTSVETATINLINEGIHTDFRGNLLLQDSLPPGGSLRAASGCQTGRRLLLPLFCTLGELSRRLPRGDLPSPTFRPSESEASESSLSAPSGGSALSAGWSSSQEGSSTPCSWIDSRYSAKMSLRLSRAVKSLTVVNPSQRSYRPIRSVDEVIG